MSQSLYLGSSILIGLWVAVLSTNINIDETCTTSLSCSPCLSRYSEQIQRCQQLYFFITYSTGDTGSRSNEAEISRYCNGECPIILATVDHYCGAQPRLDTLLQMCPSYSASPSGSLELSDEGSLCLSGTGRCLQCIGDENREAVRCLQLYLLATNQNTSSTYASQYCERSCSITLNAFTDYCGTPISDAFPYCVQTGDQYCGALRSRDLSRFTEAVASCSSDCLSGECTVAINEFGCCLRQSLGDTCSNVPNDCNLPIEASTRDLVVPDTCPVTRCSPCLRRDSRDLQRCEQTYSYLVAAEGIQATRSSSVRDRFCSGNCPILLLTSDRFCGLNRPTSTLWQICPSYDRIPSASVDIRAEFGNQSCSVPNECEECIMSNSPQPTRCLQLSLLTSHPNMSNFYHNEYCRGNCPLTLATTLWYCSNDESLVRTGFQICQRNVDEQYCAALANDNGFIEAIAACQTNCNSSVCINGVQQYRCCMNGRFSAENCPQSQTIPCAIVTAAAAPLNVMRSSLLVVVIYLIHFFANNI